MARLIGLHAGPGAGKSTIASEVFALLKKEGVNCEIVYEWAKWQVWKQVPFPIDSLTVWARQRDFIQQLYDQVDYIITDSPPLLALGYAWVEGTVPQPLFNAFRDLALLQHQQWDTLDFYIVRDTAPLPRR